MYYYENNEANFGRPLKTERKNGTHFTFDVIIKFGSALIAFRRPKGLHDGVKGGLYFPHGLIRFGETVDECVERLVLEQAHSKVKSVRLYNLPSWVDSNNHWHLCLNVIAEIEELPRSLPSEISEFVVIHEASQCKDFGWWTEEQLSGLFEFISSKG